MTLILNEIHIRDGLADTFQIAAADRRITFGSEVKKPKRKLFPIPQLNASVSYFGLAEFSRPGRKDVFMADWLQTFISRHRDAVDLADFANKLRDALNLEVPKIQREKNRSGFHLAGYRSDGLPEFWHFSNIPDMNGMYYNDPVAEYSVPSADFLQRDAIYHFGWDGKDPRSANNGGWVYRNGDIRTHVYASEKLDDAMKEIMRLPDFKKTNSIEEYADYIRFKFDVIKFVYKRWAKKKVIGDRVDILILTKDGIREKKGDKWKFIVRGSK